MFDPRMDEQMKSMQVMHDKMMAAKTPEERNALMSDQMKNLVQADRRIAFEFTPDCITSQRLAN